jgi:hypothetical protein
MLIKAIERLANDSSVGGRVASNRAQQLGE